MPQARETNKVKKSVLVPESIWTEIEALAPSTPAELAAELIPRGLSAYKSELAQSMQFELNKLEKENKLLVQQKMKQRQGDMQEAADEIDAQITNFDVMGVEIDVQAIKDAIAILKKGLTD